MKFLDSLLKAKSMGKQIVIPDIKAFSPKEGDLLKGRDPKEYARMLIEAGAPVLSVVTEEKEFHGSLEMLKAVADEAARYDVPVLRKDFVHTTADLIETKEKGASAILLMCSCLEKEELKELYDKALELGLDPFVETHDLEDLAFARELDARLIGINNRDITVLERDDGHVRDKLDMIEAAPKDAFLVTESALTCREDICLALDHGADAALVGTAILQAENPETFYRMLTAKVSLKICGLMNEADVRTCLDAGVERIGFVVEYPVYVPWNLDRTRAKELLACVPDRFQKVIVTGGSRDHIIDLARELLPDAVQLHYQETLEDTVFIAGELKKLGIRTIKTLPIKNEDRMAQFGSDDLSVIIKTLDQTEVDEILIDPRQGKAVGENNLQADQSLFAKVKQMTKKRVMLAGGLNSSNLDRILKDTGAESVDIMTGCEDNPGKKNPDEIRKLAEIVYKNEERPIPLR